MGMGQETKHNSSSVLHEQPRVWGGGGGSGQAVVCGIPTTFRRHINRRSISFCLGGLCTVKQWTKQRVALPFGPHYLQSV